MLSLKSITKYHLEVSINDVTNIPEVNGSIYFVISLRNRGKNRSYLNFKSKRILSESSSDDNKESSTHNGRTDTNNLVQSDGFAIKGKVSVKTTPRRIHNFKCRFDYNMSCNIKMSYSKKDDVLYDKYLIMKMYYIPEEEKHKDTNQNQSKHLLLGILNLNLIKYVNSEEPTPLKLLMTESKVNSIVGLLVFMRQLPEGTDFKTQLVVHDKPEPKESHDSRKLSPVDKNSRVDRNKLFGDENRELPLTSDDSDSTAQHSHMSQTKTDRLKTAYSKNQIISDPKIKQLYRNLLESMWDPQLHCILELSPEDCINDIFETGGENWREKLRSVFSQMEQRENEERDEDARQINGLISEAEYRDDWKSWSVDNYTT